MSRDERQKIVTDEYRENYDKIFNQKGGNKEKKLITRYKRNEKLSVEELKELLDYYKQRLTGNPLDMKKIKINDDKLKEKLVRYWTCPNCGYKILDAQYQSLRFDFGCPDCRTSFTKFH